MQELSAECLVESACEIGEGPVWNSADQGLYWVDCTARKIRRYQPGTGGVTEWPLTKMPGSYAFREDGSLLMAFRNALALVTLDPAHEEGLATPPLDFAIERFNDGKCDRAGRFWTGTMDRVGKNPVGSLYRVDADRTVRKMDTGITASNGMGWSPDNRTMYYADTRVGVYAYDFDFASGEIANRRLFIDNASGSHPDGLTVDAEGCLWVAEPGTSCVRRYDPKGRMERIVRLPITKPASCTFGGEDLRTLYITTLSYRLSPAELSAEPLAGALFAAYPGVQGLPEPRFAG